MSIRIMQCAWEAPCKSHTEKLVLLALADNANDEGFCWPSIDTIANKCGLSRPAVIQRTKELETRGWLRVERSGLSKGSKANRYNLLSEVWKPRPEVQPELPSGSRPEGEGGVNGVYSRGSKRGLLGGVNGVNSPGVNGVYSNRTGTRTVTKNPTVTTDVVTDGEKASSEGNTAVKSKVTRVVVLDLINRWSEAYLARTGAAYEPSKLDYVWAAKMLKRHSVDELIAVLVKAAEQTDTRTAWACVNHTGQLYTALAAWNKLNAELARIKNTGPDGQPRAWWERTEILNAGYQGEDTRPSLS